MSSNEHENPFASPQTEFQPELAPRSAGPTHLRKFVSPRGRGRVAIVCLAIVATGHALRFGVIVILRGFLGGWGIQLGSWLYQLLTVAAMIEGLGQLASMIAFIVWFYRAHANLPTLGNRLLSYSPGWAVGGWFIPIGNLVIPCQIMAEIWRGSIPRDPSEPASRHALGTGLVQGWWACWIAMGLTPVAFNLIGLYRIAHRGVPGALLVYGTLLTHILAISDAILAMLLIHRIANHQEARAALVAKQEAAQREARAGQEFAFLPPESPATTNNDPDNEWDDSLSMPWLEGR